MRTAVLLLAFAAALPAQKVELDIPYGKDPKQTIDLYLPARKDFATIVYTYGGGWHSGSGKSSQPIAEQLQKAGYACALVTHRLYPPAVFPAHAEDLAAAFAWVHAHIAERGGDPKKLVLAGHSSGAHLSLLLATDPRYLKAQHLAISDVAAVIGLSTPVDLSVHDDRRGYGDTLMAGQGAGAFARDVALMKDASPIQHISKSLPPTLLVVGQNDFPMLEGDAKRFMEKGMQAGRRVDFLLASGKDHMGVARGMLDPGDPVPRTVLEFLKAVGL
jgi:acetyl esterase/lipase